MSQNNLCKKIKEQVSAILLEVDEAADIKKVNVDRSSKKVTVKLNDDKPFSVYFNKRADIMNNVVVWSNLLKKAVKKQLRKKSHRVYYIASMTDGFKLDDLQGLEFVKIIAILSELDSVFFYATTEQFSAFNRKNNNKIVCEKNHFYTVDPIEDRSQVSVTPSNSTQNLPQFLQRIGASSSFARQPGFNYSEYAKDIYVFVLDTGISRHVLLNIDESLSKDFTNSEYGWTDVRGHGTHVAGSIAAIDRNIGVAPGVKVIAHKVLNDNGIGTLEFQIRSFKEIATFKTNNPNAKIIVNMSLGGRVKRNNIGPPFSKNKIYSNTEEQISKLSNDYYNIIFTLSAGNSTNDVSTAKPSRVLEAITVGAYDSTINTIARFSNFGTLIDIIAPGVRINSTLPPITPSNIPSTRTGLKNGTSMAAPLVTGSIVNMIAVQAMRNPNKTLTPAEIRDRLRNDAEGSFDNNRNPKIDMNNTSRSLCWTRSGSQFTEEECIKYWFNGSPSVLKQTYPYSLYIGSYTKDGATVQNY